MKNVVSALILLFALSCEKKNERLEREGEPDVVYYESDDLEMNKAIKEAKRTFLEFKKAIESENPNFSNFVLKQRFDTPDGGGEHIWISNIIYKNGNYYGSIENSPVNFKNLEYGDSVQVETNRISDWMHYNNNEVVGAFTTKVMEKNLSDEERKELKEMQNITNDE